MSQCNYAFKCSVKLIHFKVVISCHLPKSFAINCLGPYTKGPFIYIFNTSFNAYLCQDIMMLGGFAYTGRCFNYTYFSTYTMGISAAEKRINKEGWNLKNQRKTDKYGSIFEEEITKQLKKWWIRHWKINIWIFKNWKNFMHFHVKSSRFWLFKNWNCYNF